MTSVRIDRIVHGLRELSAEALIVSLPSEVLMVTGYWPVVGTSIAIVTAQGEVHLVAPPDEKQFASAAKCDSVTFIEPGSPTDPPATLEEATQPYLAAALKESSVKRNARIALNLSAVSEPAPYVAFTIYGETLRQIVTRVLPDAEIVDASELIWREKAVLMPHEIARVKQAARIAMDAYRDVASNIRAGVTEIETSQLIEAKLTIAKVSDATRAFGHVACMSGPNSVVAYGSYALSTGRRMQPGDLVLTHCNSTVDGYWTDITRTYSIGEPTADVRAMYDALLRASLAGIACVKPGARGAEIDSAVRNSLERDGFAAAFKHGTGHGVGFAAIDHRAKPRVRPHSPDVLEPGMIFNIEPGIYIDGVGGMRQCDMVLCTPDGAEVLTPFHNTIEQLML